MVFAVIGAIVDLGTMLRESTVIIQATRSGARVGAAKAAETSNSAAWCTPSGAIAGAESCDAVVNWSSGPQVALNPAIEMALRKACRYLGVTGYDPADWRVIAERNERREGTSPELRQPTIQVRIEQSDPSAKRCLICFGGMFASLTHGEATEFPAQVVCS